MWVLALASLVTVGQRVHRVRSSPAAMDPLEIPGARGTDAGTGGP